MHTVETVLVSSSDYDLFCVNDMKGHSGFTHLVPSGCINNKLGCLMS